MKKRFLMCANVALGSLSMLLAGCHSQKQAPKPDPVIDEPQPTVEDQVSPRIEKKYGPPPAKFEPPVCKYGVPEALLPE